MWILGVGGHTIAIECNIARNMSPLTWLPNPCGKWFLKPAVESE